MLLSQVRKLNLNLKHYAMYCYVADMHETQVYNILNHVKKFKVQGNRQYIATEQCVIIVDIKEYKTVVKKLAAIDL